MEQPQHEFHWTESAEPHSARRKELLQKYGPQIRALYGYDARTAYQVIAVSLFQCCMAWAVRNCSWGTILALGWGVSGFCNQNLFCAQHELSHFLAFKKPSHNKLLSILSNCPLVVPTATTFRKYHQEHHSHLGVEGWDVDLPTYVEANVICTFLLKLGWVCCYILVYGLRPVLIRPKKIGSADLVNIAVVLGFDAVLLYTCGIKSLAYLLAGTVMGGGLHPMAGHLISEHYMFVKDQETYSYYGAMNKLTYNVGYHNEHHDFPQIPQTRLPELQKIAPEYYLTLKHHTSWCYVIWAFLTDAEVGPWTRMKRKTVGGTKPQDIPAAQRAARDAAAAKAGKKTVTAPNPLLNIAADASGAGGRAVKKGN
jgi:sphingolipid delta-4 desaturase